jgi:hypothetical protein
MKDRLDARLPGVSGLAASQSGFWLERLAAWGDLWGVACLPDQLTISVSTRMRRSLGICDPTTRSLRVSAYAVKRGGALLDEVLCHEAAHAAVELLHGRGCRPHGPEWAVLMQSAGFAPRRELTLQATDFPVRDAPDKRRLYVHRCPVCQAVRVARRPVPQWRCAACSALGLDGVLVISERNAIR